mmetsp:Transcript_34000/g.108034  ORF Transcript_34000/g.108034 Transcript_34000/m.108034 type:complete len:259 (-) Transcript_34000:1892-2668(-)
MRSANCSSSRSTPGSGAARICSTSSPRSWASIASRAASSCAARTCGLRRSRASYPTNTLLLSTSRRRASSSARPSPARRRAAAERLGSTMSWRERSTTGIARSRNCPEERRVWRSWMRWMSIESSLSDPYFATCQASSSPALMASTAAAASASSASVLFRRASLYNAISASSASRLRRSSTAFFPRVILSYSTRSASRRSAACSAFDLRSPRMPSRVWERLKVLTHSWKSSGSSLCSGASSSSAWVASVSHTLPTSRR